MDNAQRKQSIRKPIAVLTSDIHYNLNTLEIADKALNQSVDKANELKVPLIIAGDLHDSKANIRAECVKTIRSTLRRANSPPYLIVGNHSLVNERSSDHALHFLSDIGPIIDKPVYQHKLGYLIPYYSDTDALRTYLKTLPKKSQLIMHQGIQGSNSGEYIQDKSAITKDDVAGFRVISGHYHNRQTIKLPDNGTWDYIGNPYTLNFAEANDPAKGYQILMNDGTLEFVSTNLRKHVIAEAEILNKALVCKPFIVNSDEDLVWVKLKGTKEDLATFNKHKVAELLRLGAPFKLAMITEDIVRAEQSKPASKPELLDSIIDSTNNSNDCKMRLKQTWRDLCE